MSCWSVVDEQPDCGPDGPCERDDQPDDVEPPWRRWSTLFDGLLTPVSQDREHDADDGRVEKRPDHTRLSPQISAPDPSIATTATAAPEMGLDDVGDETPGADPLSANCAGPVSVSCMSASNWVMLVTYVGE